MKKITFIIATIVILALSHTVSAQISGNFTKVSVRDSIFLNGKWFSSLDFIPINQKGAATGVASLDAGGKLPMGQLPDIVTSVAGRVGAITLDTSDITNFSSKVRPLFTAGTGITYNPDNGMISNTGAPATGGTGYIWNSTAGQTGSFYITGTGRIGNRFLVDGNVGIGTQSPNSSSQLHVNGASFLQGQVSVQSGNITMAVPGSLIMYTGTGNTAGVLTWVKSTSGTGASLSFSDDGGLTINGSTKFNSTLQTSKLSLGASIFAPSLGVVTIPSGNTTATINTAAVTANSRIILTVQDGSGATFAGASVTGRTAGTSFSIVTNVSTGVTVAWMIVEPY